MGGKEEFAKRLDELIHDPDARAEMGAAGREQAAGWTIEEGWRKWESAYEQIAGVTTDEEVAGGT